MNFPLSVTPSKERGQNFIINPFVVEKIVQFGAPQPNEKLVEIGPGLGALTSALVGVAPLTIVEIEPRFCAHSPAKYPSLSVVQSMCGELTLQRLAPISPSLGIFRIPSQQTLFFIF